VKAQAEWTVRTEGPVASYSAAKRGKLIGIGLSAKHQGQRSYQTALTGRRHDCTRPAKLKHRLNHLAKRAPSRHYDAEFALIRRLSGAGMRTAPLDCSQAERTVAGARAGRAGSNPSGRDTPPATTIGIRPKKTTGCVPYTCALQQRLSLAMFIKMSITKHIAKHEDWGAHVGIL